MSGGVSGMRRSNSCYEHPLEEDFLVKLALMHPEPPDLNELHELVREMMRMMHQKTGGETKKHSGKGDISVAQNYERVRMGLLNCGIRLALSGMLDRANTSGPMPPAVVVDKTGMKDRDRNEALMRETFWGQQLDPEDLKGFVSELARKLKEHQPDEYLRRLIILETVTIVLSGRLDDEQVGEVT